MTRKPLKVRIERLPQTSKPSDANKLLGAMADRVSEILTDYLPTETSKDEMEWSAIMDAAPYAQPQTLSDAVFLLLLAHNQMGYLADLCDTPELSHEEKKAEAERYRRPIDFALRNAIDLLLRQGAKLCPVTRQYYMSDYLDPRLTDDERQALCAEEPGTQDRLLAEATKVRGARR